MVNINDMGIIAERIRLERKNLGFSVQKLAEKTGLTVHKIIKAENGSCNVCFDDYLTIFAALGIIDSGAISGYKALV